ncbi:MAG: UPF0182 family protein [Gemmatimonadetes bacterium]|nr:UPF0182 family protein [Gemmatimonadota bacterium]
MKRGSVRLLLGIGLAVVLLVVVGRAAITLYTDVLWYETVGLTDVLWTRVSTTLMVRVVTAVAGGAFVLANLARVVRHLGPVQLRRRYGNLEIAEVVPRAYVRTGIILAAGLAGWWLSGISFPGGSTLGVLAWLNHVPWGQTDPLFQRDLAFYVFSLPLYNRILDFLLLVVVWSTMLALVGYVLVGAVRVRSSRLEIDDRPRGHFALLVGGIVLLFAVRYWMGRYGVLLDGSGFGGGVGYTDEHARLAAYRALAVISLAATGALVWAAARRSWIPAIAAIGLLVLTGAGLGIVYPALVQKIRVVPNQLEREERYIQWNLDFTRRAYGLDGIDRRTMGVQRAWSPRWSALQPALERLPLWDAEPLQIAFRERESLKGGYYHFPSVHADRYGPTDDERPVAIAVREFTAAGLAPDAQTWSTLHLNAELVRGNGAVVTSANEKTADGDPVFWLSGIDPVRRSPGAPADVELRHTSVYFGETTDGYVVVRSDSLPGSDLAPPRGIVVGSLVRRIALAWQLGDRNLLFTGELTAESRLLHRRGIQERLRTIAPWILWDRAPLPVFHEGRIVWMVDGFSISTTYPIARPFPIDGVNGVRYVRNSVKATVDARTGEVAFYALDENEPVLAAWSRAFPGLFQPLDALPHGLRAHLRYPAVLLRLQAHVLEEYHVDDPAAFFSGQNVWQVPGTTTGPQGVGSPSAPLYTMIPAPDGGVEFMLVTPFAARERQNMTAIVLVANRAEEYGRITLLQLPRDALVAGPRQIRTIIEQDPTISAGLSLWRQSGSDVDLGELRIVPLDSAFLYVQPVFLKGSGGEIPQLQRVIVSDGTSVFMASTLRDAVIGLSSGEDATADPPLTPESVPDGDWITRAIEVMNAAERALRNGQFDEFGRRWTELQDLLRRASAAQAVR